MASDRMASDRMASDRMMMTEANRISSMRNPPVVFLPTEFKNDSDRSNKAIAPPRRVADYSQDFDGPSSKG